MSGDRLILSHSPGLRLLTLLLFYFTQGFPVGLFFYAVPSWMATSGASTGEIAAVVSTASLPWSLKLVNGFVIDRYTFLPMGRRRAWIIGAQATIVAVLLAGALLVPGADDILLLSAIGFAANMAVTVQDVGIDSLAVDIMAEDERARAGGIMFGAQLMGISSATWLGGTLLAAYGISACLAVLAAVPGVVALYGALIRERAGERRLPWSAGASHPANLDVQVEAWRPLLVNALRAITLPLSLLLLPALLVRSLPAGSFETFHPLLFSETGGWSLTDYTDFNSTLVLVVGITGLVVGGWLVDVIGAQRSMLGAMAIGVVLLTVMGAVPQLWSQDWVLIGFVSAMELAGLFYAIAMIPICMRMCSPAVAATQFTIYMAIGNFGRPLGASLAAATAGAGHPQWLYWSLAIIWAMVALVLWRITLPNRSVAERELAAQLPQGEGLQPIEN